MFPETVLILKIDMGYDTHYLRTKKYLTFTLVTFLGILRSTPVPARSLTNNFSLLNAGNRYVNILFI